MIMGKQYKQKFKREWLTNPVLKKWLIEKKNSSGASVAFCNHCNLSLNSNKLSDLQAHGKTQKHVRQASLMAGSVRQQQQQAIPFETVSKLTDAQVAEGKLALFIAEHTSIITCDHLSSMCKSCFKDSRIASQIQLKRTKCSGIIKNVLYPHFMDDIKLAVGNNPYSLLIDESTDISKVQNLGLAIIYYDLENKKLVYTFLALAPLEQCTAVGIVSCLKATIKAAGLHFL